MKEDESPFDFGCACFIDSGILGGSTKHLLIKFRSASGFKLDFVSSVD